MDTSKTLRHSVTKMSSSLKRNNAIFLTGLGVIGLGITVVSAVKATPKAILLKEELSTDEQEDILTVVKQCYKPFVPTVIFGSLTVGCMISAVVLNQKHQASLTSAYGLLNESYKKYRQAAIKVYGEDADEKIQAEVAKEMYIRDGYGLMYQPHLDNSEIITFYDSFSQRYFTSTLAAVINAQYHFNRNLSMSGAVCVNHLYDLLGLDLIDGMDEIGWNIDMLSETGYMWLDFDNEVVELEDGMQCYHITTIMEPEMGYEDW